MGQCAGATSSQVPSFSRRGTTFLYYSENQRGKSFERHAFGLANRQLLGTLTIITVSDPSPQLYVRTLTRYERRRQRSMFLTPCSTKAFTPRGALEQKQRETQAVLGTGRCVSTFPWQTCAMMSQQSRALRLVVGPALCPNSEECPTMRASENRPKGGVVLSSTTKRYKLPRADSILEGERNPSWLHLTHANPFWALTFLAVHGERAKAHVHTRGSHMAVAQNKSTLVNGTKD